MAADPSLAAVTLNASTCEKSLPPASEPILMTLPSCEREPIFGGEPATDGRKPILRAFTACEGEAGPKTVAVDEREPDPAVPAAPVDTQRWATLATAALRAEGVGGGELGLLFVGPDRMAGLNLAHMGVEGPTDVLAFPLDGGGGAGTPGTAVTGAATGQARAAHPTRRSEGTGAPDAAILIGDVVVCPERAMAQAARHAGPHHNGSLEDELALLVVHGVLHVLGYDHANDSDAALMQALERRLLAAHHRQP